MSGRFKSCGLVALYFTRECRKFTSTWPKWNKFRHFGILALKRGSGMSSLFCPLAAHHILVFLQSFGDILRMANTEFLLFSLRQWQ
jgi:hypothetical protein